MTKLLDYLNSISVEYSLNVELKEISTFKIGGNASIVCYPASVYDVSKIVKFCRGENQRFIVLGRCSNVVFSDDGLSTLVIKTDRLDDISFEDGRFVFGAGVMLARASKYSVDNGFAGMEFAYGIPGSVGGAVYMNAGAYGGEMSQIVYSTEYVDDCGDIKNITLSEHEFGYRHSFFTDKDYIVTSVKVKLDEGDMAYSNNLIREFQTARKEKQPLEFPSAGSVFKRPEGYFAGKLIQDCGFKGYSVGGAKVSEKHSGFIINTGNASCEDVKTLVKEIQTTVFDKFNVSLECELKFISD